MLGRALSTGIMRQSLSLPTFDDGDFMILFLDTLPLWLLAILLNVWLGGIALIGLWVSRRFLLPRMRLGYDDAYAAAAIVQSVMMLYGLIAALTAVGVWQRYNDVANVVSAEATAITTLWRDTGGYPEPMRENTREILRGYSDQIVQEAWPKQRRGEVPSEGVEWMDRFQAVVYSFEPATESQKILHAETIRSFSNLVQHRRQRLDSVHAALPGVMWWVLLPGAMGCLVLCLFFHVPNVYLHGIMLCGLAGFLSMVLFVIITLDRLFTGEMGIPADSYQLIIDYHMK